MKKDTSVFGKILDLPWNNFDPKKIILALWQLAEESASSYDYVSTKSVLDIWGVVSFYENTEPYYFPIGLDPHEFLRIQIAQTKSLENVPLKTLQKGILYSSDVKEWLQVDGSKNQETTVSRLRKLPIIYKKILDSHNWKALDFNFMDQYLTASIKSADACGDILERQDWNDIALEALYEKQLEFFKCLKD